MAKDVGSTIASMAGTIAREVAESISDDGHRDGNGHLPFGKEGGQLSGARGMAAGAALATAVPLVGKAARRLVFKRIGSPVDAAKSAGDGVAQKVTKGAKDAVGDKVEAVGGAPGIAKEVGKKMVPGIGGGGKGKGKKGTPGVGKGRRMPVQQAVDVAVPLAVAYNQWTQFEEWPQFMHRIDRVTQEDECTVSFRTKVWGMSKEFVAQIVEQRPEERIQWSVTEGVTHTGVVTFHELAPNLTRIQVSLDVEPGSWIEKMARGMRHVKRAVRADLARFKAFIEVQEVETGAWRGKIHDGEVVEQHDRKYDRGREYADFDDVHDREHSHGPQRKTSRSTKSRSSKSRRGSGSHGSRRRGKSKARGGGSRKRGSSR
ncbi:MAG TPA: SRPBCC family protein [Solirubrobacterales bacterium]|nr:SRPBCC family protein [Solirubrobacterales bacterium]